MAKEMIRRKDGSYSQRGLWDNIRANRGSGKKPTSQMLKQEKKIKMAKIKKAQKGTRTPMQVYKSKYPDADTSRRGDYRFDELPPGIPSAARKRDEAMRKAFDAKYGKGKPASSTTRKKTAKKAQNGVSTRKSQDIKLKSMSQTAQSAAERAAKVANAPKRAGAQSALKKGMKKAQLGASVKPQPMSSSRNKSSVGASAFKAAKKIGKAFLGIGIGKDARMARRADRQARMQSKENVRRSNRNVCKMNRAY